METNNSTELINQLSDEFSRLIVEGFTADQLAEVNAKNATDKYKNCCATHDYYDANEFMSEAFNHVMNREIDLQNDNDIDLWNAAWALSKSKNFAVDPCMSDLDENGDIIPYSDEEAKQRLEEC